MEPITILALVNAALGFVKTAIPEIQKLIANGEISAEDQAKELAEFNDLREHLAEKFEGPEWEQSGR